MVTSGGSGTSGLVISEEEGDGEEDGGGLWSLLLLLCDGKKREGALAKERCGGGGAVVAAARGQRRARLDAWPIKRLVFDDGAQAGERRKSSGSSHGICFKGGANCLLRGCCRRSTVVDERDQRFREMVRQRGWERRRFEYF